MFLQWEIREIKILHISRTVYMKIAVLFRDTNDLRDAATCKTCKKYAIPV